MSSMIKMESEGPLNIKEHDIQEALGKFAKSLGKEEIARFNMIYAQRDASVKSLLSRSA